MLETRHSRDESSPLHMRPFDGEPIPLRAL